MQLKPACEGTGDLAPRREKEEEKAAAEDAMLAARVLRGFGANGRMFAAPVLRGLGASERIPREEVLCTPTANIACLAETAATDADADVAAARLSGEGRRRGTPKRALLVQLRQGL